MQITVTYTLPGSINWYTVSSGGSSIGSGSPFNPVGVAGSGLANTNTSGTTIFYAECALHCPNFYPSQLYGPGCRTATDFIINGSNRWYFVYPASRYCVPAQPVH